jgi:hypothetical protein
MQDMKSNDAVALENQLTERFGLLLSQTQLAELLGRSTGGLRYSLSYRETSTHAISRPVAARSDGVCTIQPRR